ncbi:MAG: peptidase S58 family protein [Acidobacteria bacterium]|nr:peptidase S58 family protein [Acidobacteriota bacterium]
MLKPALVLAACGMLVAMALAQSTPASRGKGLTEVEGLKVGQITLTERPTGCTVVLVDGQGVPGGVSQRGGAPGTRETDLLDPLNLVDKVNAIVLAGGSAYGLDAAQGVVRYLDERKIGWDVGAAGVVPIVPSAILFDLGFGGDPKIRPTADCGYKAALAATDGPVQEGNVGAGAGATIGKVAGRDRSMKSGIGSAAIRLPNGLTVGAIVAVNAVGDVIDPTTGQVVAGVRTQDGRTLADARKLLRDGSLMQAAAPRAGGNTTIAVVATNAKLTKVDVNRVALMADDGLARAISPSHTIGDGDTVFALATGRWTGQVDASIVGALAAEVLAEAIVRAATQADSLGGLPSARQLGTVPTRLR